MGDTIKKTIYFEKSILKYIEREMRENKIGLSAIINLILAKKMKGGIK